MKLYAKIAAAVVPVVGLLAFAPLRKPNWLPVWVSYPSGVGDFAARSANGQTIWPGPGREHLQRLPAYELAAAELYVLRHPDRSSYLLLDELREYFPDAFARLPHDTRAAVLCDALKHHECYNDWEILTTNPDRRDGEAACSLAETGRAALPYLRPLLDDQAYFHYESFKAYSPSLDDRYRISAAPVGIG